MHKDKKIVCFVLGGEGNLLPNCHSGLANSHLQLCCLVDMVLGTGKPGSPLMNAKKIC